MDIIGRSDMLITSGSLRVKMCFTILLAKKEQKNTLIVPHSLI